MSILHESDIFLLFPEIFLSTASLCLLMYGATLIAFSENDVPLDKYSADIYPTIKKNASLAFFQKEKNESGKKRPLMMTNVIWLSILSIILTGFLLLNNPINIAYIFFHSLLIDDFTSFCKFLVLFGSSVSFLMSIRYFKVENINAFEYAILMLLATTSMLLMISSYDLLSFYLTIELQSLCFYVLAASKRQSEFSTEAGLKYFFLGAFSSGILLFGSSMIYGFTGSTHFGDIAQLFTGYTYDTVFFKKTTTTDHGMLVGVLFLSIGFLFKLSAAPFHMWAPDVYEGSPTPITAFFSIVPKIAFLAVFCRFFLVCLHEFPWHPIILFCSMSSMILGAFAALSQKKIKRILAFSAVGHIGYILMGTCCGTIEGIQALCIYIVIYLFMTICLFAAVLSLRRKKQVFFSNFSKKFSIQDTSIKYINDLSILSKTNPILAITFSICLFSMAGIPPLAGFCSKFYLFFAAISSSLYVTAFLGIATSCISCFFYIRLIKIMYFEKPTQWIEFDIIDKQKAILLGITLFGILCFFLYPAPLFLYTHKLALLLTC